MSDGNEQVPCIADRCKWAIMDRTGIDPRSLEVKCAAVATVFRTENIRATLAQELMLMTAALKQMRSSGFNDHSRKQSHTKSSGPVALSD